MCLYWPRFSCLGRRRSRLAFRAEESGAAGLYDAADRRATTRARFGFPPVNGRLETGIGTNIAGLPIMLPGRFCCLLQGTPDRTMETDRVGWRNRADPPPRIKPGAP